jgi:hypothetical protein
MLLCDYGFEPFMFSWNPESFAEGSMALRQVVTETNEWQSDIKLE